MITLAFALFVSALGHVYQRILDVDQRSTIKVYREEIQKLQRRVARLDAALDVAARQALQPTDLPALEDQAGRLLQLVNAVPEPEDMMSTMEEVQHYAYYLVWHLGLVQKPDVIAQGIPHLEEPPIRKPAPKIPPFEKG